MHILLYFICLVGFSATGFYSSAIIYAVFAVFSWFAPSVMVVLGLKVNGYKLYMLMFATFDIYLQGEKSPRVLFFVDCEATVYTVNTKTFVLMSASFY